MPQRPDDQSIPNHELLWRRLLPRWLHKQPDGSFRPSSMAFLDDTPGNDGEVSVDVASRTTTEKSLTAYPGQGLAELEANVPRSLRHTVVSDPIENNLAHAVICPPPDIPNNQRKRDARQMAEKALLRILPNG
jgi:hypothetical protein